MYPNFGLRSPLSAQLTSLARSTAGQGRTSLILPSTSFDPLWLSLALSWLLYYLLTLLVFRRGAGDAIQPSPCSHRLYSNSRFHAIRVQPFSSRARSGEHSRYTPRLSSYRLARISRRHAHTHGNRHYRTYRDIDWNTNTHSQRYKHRHNYGNLYG